MVEPDSPETGQPIDSIGDASSRGLSRRRFLTGTIVAGATAIVAHFLPPSLRIGTPLDLLGPTVTQAGGHCNECGCPLTWTYGCGLHCSLTDICDDYIDRRWGIYWYRWWGEPHCLSCNVFCGLSGPFTECQSRDCEAGCA